MVDSYTLKLSLLQIDILLQTVEGFVDNKKILHIPDHTGKIVSLPFTREVLQDLKSVLEDNGGQGLTEIVVELEKENSFTGMKLTLGNSVFNYRVELDEFDVI